MTDLQCPSDGPRPVDVLAEHAEQQLRVEWSDGHVSVFDFAYLKRVRPSPTVPAEHVLAEEEEEGDGSFIANVRIIGSDSIGVIFEDGEEEVIYSFQLLRNLCPCGMHGGPEAEA